MLEVRLSGYWRTQSDTAWPAEFMCPPSLFQWRTVWQVWKNLQLFWKTLSLIFFFFFAWHWGVQPMVGMSRLLRTCSHPDPTRIYSDSSKWTQYTLPVCSLGYGYFAEKFTFCASCPHQFNGISQDQWRSQEPCDYLCDQGLIPDDISKPLTLVDSTVLIADLYNMCTIVMVEKAW